MRSVNASRLSALALPAFMLVATMCGCHAVDLNVADSFSAFSDQPAAVPDFTQATQMSLAGDGTTVAVIFRAPLELKWNNNKIDRELSEYVSHRMANHGIRAIDTDRIFAWLDQHPEQGSAEEIGKAFETAYVVDVDLKDYSLYEEDSPSLRRGRAHAIVTVYDMTEGGSAIYTRTINSVYPERAPRSSSKVSHATFRRQYLTRLTDEIGRLFYVSHIEEAE